MTRDEIDASAAPDVAPTDKHSLTVAEQLAGLYPILSRLADPSNNRLGCGLDKLVAEAVGCYSDMVGLTQTYSATVDQAQADAVEIARLKACIEAADAKVTLAARDVLMERVRQVTAEGWTPEHDDSHTDGQLALAASAYAMPNAVDGYTPRQWPWSFAWWKPSTPRRNLVKAAALILAEIERLDRAALGAKGE